MNNKKKKLVYDYHNYLEDNYSGLSGYLFRRGHIDLEKNLHKSSYDNVLEIGAGMSPHITYIKHKFKNYTILETSDVVCNFLKKNFNNLKIIKYNGLDIPLDDQFFDRIIISHTLEHITNYEDFIESLLLKLKDDGCLSIGLPTDPGILWRIGRKIRQIMAKNNDLSVVKYNYLMAREHVSSVFNIRSVLQYKYPNKFKESFYPLKIKSLDINLFYNVQLFKKDE